MLQVKIVNTKNLYLEEEERAINNAIQELVSKDYMIQKVTYRQNSTIIEYQRSDMLTN